MRELYMHSGTLLCFSVFRLLLSVLPDESAYGVPGRSCAFACVRMGCFVCVERVVWWKEGLERFLRGGVRSLRECTRVSGDWYIDEFARA
jgi:hypothetical protein